MRIADALGKALRAQMMRILSEAGNISLDEIKREESLKSKIVSDPFFCIHSVSEESFKVSVSPSDLCRALLRDYYFGYERVKAQWESTTLLATEEKVAWAIISAYYCAFFGVIEALRLCKIHALSLTSDESEETFAGIGGAKVLKLATKRNFRGTISDDFTEIGYTSTGEKPHQAVWRMFNEDVLPIIPKSSIAKAEALKFSNICCGKSGWERPSDIRNRWNYRDPIYFGELGLKSSNPFLKLIDDENAASTWIRSQVSIRSENDSAASLAVTAKLLHISICDTFNFGFLTSSNFID